MKFDQAPRVARAIVYVELADGKKIMYDMQDLPYGVTVNHDWGPYMDDYQSEAYLRVPQSRRSDVTFEFPCVGAYTMYQGDGFNPPPAPDQKAIALPAKAVEPPVTN